MAEKETSSGFGRWLIETIVLVALAFVLAMGIKTFVVGTFMIPTGSMVPTIQVGDRVLANRFIYRFQSPKRGDIVVFRAWQPGGSDLIKRIVALPGETIDMDAEGRFTIDGKPLSEPYVAPDGRRTIRGDYLPFTVPEGQVFVMGDNRNNSSDSRFNGGVRISDILGKAFATYWPPQRIHGL